MARIALGIEYDGTDFRGWQTQQAGVRTVQECLEKAISKVANHPVAVVCAGRTDAGVHGTGQVVHFDSDAPRAMKSWIMGVNTNLPYDVSVRWATPVSDQFHARFSAVSRRYRYVIYNNGRPPALYRNQVTWNHRPLDVQRMREAACLLEGTHDFTSYRSVHCQAKSPVKTLHSLRLYEHGKVLILEAHANAFLMHMVRNISGVLMTVGAGKQAPGWAAEVLEARDRRVGAATAPPYGLYLVDIEYPPEFALPKEPLGPLWLPHQLGES
ncbi:MAG: tRNA pseudouridine(38-40) synthase TruA [Alcanivoracaceae bacterium]|uniref:tRNA pseudouridine(38-40) synthase TruA n=1 Tax=Alcanivorax sp. MD8A TaxID=1177157 RepID=UPI000C67531A|nr:tRNA pseudouridine(38-40) synthase TruA [Alcanivorax sp. MD8A]MAX54267.1 tRNA pseudouridine(38-40) synthase TruA [Alcanivoracaceae bacterium]MCG8437638.1 tRNA pseudouridine(38-40) synthase TruA [Pseudomonadales bacterium]PNE03472.1 tRNA pseudouridine synthase A [Alcanivorax sp. MD8A]|tara:strand:+ start:1772 stop:2578 length:807 start_codon:yes stop_codon:yes gene_type:complete